ncbi:hypothetical protein NC653_040696 [Populus alba x Populus x berolinensis]|uniref:Lipoprotein n=1 Tax=Populus alba x Populus x berolinensis TaxID=444605 RepID=A0AAD6L953_9ROSI|nr:hypothetical protein NC653_040696 [Populus alba x Populus x berolinensis]
MTLLNFFWQFFLFYGCRQDVGSKTDYTTVDSRRKFDFIAVRDTFVVLNAQKSLSKN